MADHEHKWGPLQHGTFTGEPSRPCMVEGCRIISLDLDYATCKHCNASIFAETDEDEERTGLWLSVGDEDGNGTGLWSCDPDGDQKHEPL